MPYLISGILASNIGGTATLIGDPPNIMIGSAAGLDFDDFLFNLAPGHGRSCSWRLPRDRSGSRSGATSRCPTSGARPRSRTKEEGAIKDRPLLIRALVGDWA